MNIRKYPSSLIRYQEIVVKSMQKVFNDYELPIYDHLKYFLGWIDIDGKPVKKYQGKILRPSLCLLASDSVEGDLKVSLRAAVALEFIHNFSLIHDDIEDQDKYRRHRLSLWAIWGIPTAIVSGNALLTLGNLEISKLSNESLSQKTISKTQRLLTTSYLKMMEGQFLDIKYESIKSITIDEYLRMVNLKTSTLLECSLMLGIITANKNNNELISNFSSLGKILGLIFQIRDDILGIWGTDKTGKHIGADIKRKKKNLPILHVLANNNSVLSEKVNKIFSKESITEFDINLIIEILDKAGSEEYCQNLINHYWSKGEKIIKTLDIPSSFKQDFNELGLYLSVRSS